MNITGPPPPAPLSPRSLDQLALRIYGELLARGIDANVMVHRGPHVWDELIVRIRADLQDIVRELWPRVAPSGWSLVIEPD